MRNRITLALKGAAMGMAEVIPGVSGGTIAFITGIYETLLESIDHFRPARVAKQFRRGGVALVWRDINGPFLLNLLFGMFLGVGIGIFGVSHLVETYPEASWAFFFGLIVASALYIGGKVPTWRWQEVLALVVGTAIAYGITVASPAQSNEALWFVFLCGAIAVSALILPGVSGSFILLLLGMYTFILGTVKTALETLGGPELLTMGVFLLGLLTGLFTIARLLSWLFDHYEGPTLALLTGFMIGSLNRLWPWQNVLSYRENSAGERVPFLQEPVLPGNYDGEPFVLAVLLSALVGFGIVFLLGRYDQTKSPAPEPESLANR